MSEKRFQATIAQSGARAYVVIPFDPDAVWGAKDRHYVAGSINGHTIRGAIDSDGPRPFMALGPSWCRDKGMEAGTEVEVVLAPEEPLSGSLSPDVAAALDAEPEAKRFFDSVAPFYRKNYVRWIESAKRPETRRARIDETVRSLKAGKKRQ